MAEQPLAWRRVSKRELASGCPVGNRFRLVREMAAITFPSNSVIARRSGLPPPRNALRMYIPEAYISIIKPSSSGHIEAVETYKFTETLCYGAKHNIYSPMSALPSASRIAQSWWIID